MVTLHSLGLCDDSARVGAIYFLPFGNVWLASVCRVQRVATKQNAEFTKDGRDLQSYFKLFVGES